MTLFSYLVIYHIDENMCYQFHVDALSDSDAVECALEQAILVLSDKAYLHCEMTAPDIICIGEAPKFNLSDEILKATIRIAYRIHVYANWHLQQMEQSWARSK